MNNASKGLSPQMALLLVQGVQGEEGVTLGDAQGALDRLVAAGTIRESYVDAVKATLMIPDDPKIAKNMREWGEKLTNDMLRTWYGERAVNRASRARIRHPQGVEQQPVLQWPSKAGIEVVDFHPCRDRPMDDFPDKAVDVPRLAGVEPAPLDDAQVAIGVLLACHSSAGSPDPTRSWLYQEARVRVQQGRRRLGGHCAPPGCGLRSAPRASPQRSSIQA